MNLQFPWHKKVRSWTRLLARQCSSYKDMNLISHTKHHNWINQSEESKRLRAEETISPAFGPVGVNSDIKTLIRNENNSTQILSAIQQNVNVIEHAAIFGKAMQKCNKLRDWKAVQSIMDLLLSTTVEPSVIEFTIFFNSMAHSDSPHTNIQYFDKMINEYSLRPDIPVFSALIKSFRRQGRLRDAERFWKMMRVEYTLDPDQLLYTEMLSVYAKCRELEKGKLIFNEYQSKVEEGTLAPDMPTYSAYLNLFSRCGDIKGMEHANKLMHEAGLDLDGAAVADIMRGYYVARNCDGCILVYQKWVSHGYEPNASMLSLKCIALAHKIQTSSDEFSANYALYQQLLDTIYNETAKYGIAVDPILAITELDGAIFLYRNHDPMKIVNVFEKMTRKGLIDWKAYDTKLGKHIIDLRSFQPWQAQFILRYLIAFQLNEILHMLVDEELRIIVGRGKHAGGPLTQKKGKLRDFLIHELNSWTPPLEPSVHGSNQGMIYIKKSNLMAYSTESNNFALQTFKKSSV